LREHLTDILASWSDSPAVNPGELRALRKRAERVLKQGRHEDCRDLGAALTRLSAESHAKLEEVAARGKNDLPTAEELNAGGLTPDLELAVRTLFGIIGAAMAQPVRERGKPVDYWSAALSHRLTLAYALSVGAPGSGSLGRYEILSPYQRYMAAVLTHLGQRSPEASGAPKQARLARARIDEAVSSRLARGRAEDNDDADNLDE